jgi:hypothetical protein
MTRDRKKSFISPVEQTIVQLERDNQQMRNIWTKVADLTGSESVTPVGSPKLVPINTPDYKMKSCLFGVQACRRDPNLFR